MKLYDYIKTIYPILESSNFEKMVKIICDTFDYLHELNYKMINNYFVDSCDNVKEKAAEQSILIFPQDNETTLKAKTYEYYKFLKSMNTKDGIIDIISKYYFKRFEVLDVRDLGNFRLDYSCIDVDSISGNSDSEFVLQVYEELDDETKKLLKTILDNVKPSHISYIIEEVFDFPYFKLEEGQLNRGVLGEY